MPTPIPPGLKLGTVEPDDAVAAFDHRSLLQPSFRWQDVWQDEHARAFAVAGVSRLDVLKVFQDEMDVTVREGRSLADFRARIRPQLAAKGFWGNVEVRDVVTGETRITQFNDARLRTIFGVNMRQSMAAGRWARIERNKKRFPLVMYSTMHDERVRTSHRPWDGVTLPVDHPWWNTHYPPCGWRCRCRAFATNERDLARRRDAGQTITTEAPPEQLVTYVNPATGEVVPVPRGIDPGFAYNPGKTRDAALYEQMLRKSLQSSPLAGATAVAQATLDHGAMVLRAQQGFGDWVDRIQDTRRTTGELKFIGAIKPQAVRAMQAHGIELTTAAVAVRDRDVVHALRTDKLAEIKLPVDIYKRLPELIAKAQALVLDKLRGPDLLYIVEVKQDDGRLAKLVLQLNVLVKVGRVRGGQMNVLHTATLMNTNALVDKTRYEVVWGTL